jgi:hypothetical protein
MDGSDKDWADSSRHYDEKTNSKTAIYNDNDSLYIYLVPMNPDIQMSIQRHSLTLWLCKTGKREKVWGLRYPFLPQGIARFGNDEREDLNQLTGNAFLILDSEKDPGRALPPFRVTAALHFSINTKSAKGTKKTFNCKMFRIVTELYCVEMDSQPVIDVSPPFRRSAIEPMDNLVASALRALRSLRGSMSQYTADPALNLIFLPSFILDHEQERE